MRLRISITIVLVLFLVGMLPNLSTTHYLPRSDSSILSNNPDSSMLLSPPNAIPASHSESGKIDPLEIEQRGYVSTGVTTARTDTMTNIASSLSIDTVHDWVASEANATISNLQRLYIVNGTLDEGIPGTNDFPNETSSYYPYGWTTDSYFSIAGTTQRSSYFQEESYYVVLEDEGNKLGTGANTRYQHGNQSFISWNQTIDNRPYSEDFIFSVNFIYRNGPLEPLLGDGISLEVWINGTRYWNQSLAQLASRDVWYSSGDININIPGASDSLAFDIRLMLKDDVVLYETDYGVFDSAYFTVQLDDISFTRYTPPSPEEVDLIFNAGSMSGSVTGSSGVGTAKLTNSSYWNVSSLPISFESNTSISFDYDVHLLSHRFTNSTWTTDNTKEGVYFTVDSGSSPQAETYSYLGFSGTYENLTQSIIIPPDWENITVYDPFLSDVTSQCSFYSGSFVIPESLLTRLGWWKFTAELPNYGLDIATQISSSASPIWSNATTFRSTNWTRASIAIGTASESPTSVMNAEIGWYFPNDTLWAVDVFDSPTGNVFNSSPYVLGSANTTAGSWSVAVLWYNGTEVAYISSTFEIHHQSELVVENAIINTDAGEIITNMVRYRDIETNQYIMDPSSNIIANWSVSTVIFQPNPVHNWWEGNFDTSIIGGGEFLVQVNASATYYDSANCTFIIRSILTGNVLTIDITTAETNLLQTYTAEFTYKDQFLVGIESGLVTITYDGPSGGLTWGLVQDLGSGEYRVDFTASISGSYTIQISANRSYYESASDVLLLDVGTLAAFLTSDNGSIRTIGYGQQFHLVLRYTNGTGYGLPGATVSTVSTTPSTGLTITNPSDFGDGNYSMILDPTVADTYTILFEANITNHDRKLFTFTISVTDLSSILTIESSQEFIDIDQNSTILFSYENETGYGIVGASFEIISPPAGLTFSSVTELGNGMYELVITPTEVGSYQLRFKASAENYLDATTSAPLEVGYIQMILIPENPASSYEIYFGDSIDIPLILQRLNQDGIPVSNISLTEFSMEIQGPTGISWSILPEELQPGHYMLTLSGDVVDSWVLTITANKSLYDPVELEIPFSILARPTDINEFEPRTCIYGRSYQFTFDYVLLSNGSLIEGAGLDISGSGSDYITWAEDVSGYIVTLNSLEIGPFSVVIEFSKEGHESQTSTLEFEVERVPVRVTTDTDINWEQYDPLYITVTLSDADSSQPITNATITILLHIGSSRVFETTLDEDTPGLYNGQILADYWHIGDMQILVSVQKQNHLANEVTITVDPISAPLSKLIVLNIIPLSAISVLLIMSAVSILYSRRRNRRLRRAALEVKSTFDDANNLLGVLILHKNSGLPFYSKILKGGFEEGMLSAFVTAVTHFRSEFENNGADREWKLTPISDIIRAGATRNLICAFVTMTSPSLVHEAKMVMFTREIGLLLDDQMETPPTEFRDDRTGKIIEEMFDDYLDGILLKEYRFPVEGALPRRYRKISDARSVAGLGDTFTLTELNRGLEALGFEEAEGFKILHDAVDDGQLWPIDRDEDHLPPFSS